MFVEGLAVEQARQGISFAVIEQALVIVIDLKDCQQDVSAVL